ncbi:putative transcription factor interactor and regulator CCHC(Zn) family [Helianthus annuus]|uniref:Transcription factor interactor and regulator CCHC(Zn) family n=1 Tax=Helianthus annuus TaxID=4232 RepID=A0A9K3EBP2_HELAN|nr:putative transcription factor interactor and regulator CCHC(Zn) family [Helianthus annuus]
MPAYHSSAANVMGDVSDFQHSGIRATSRNQSEIEPNSTTLPCQHCTDEQDERNRRNTRIRLCYYCHLPGHQIYNCKAKENDEVTQLLRQAINAGIKRKEEDVHCRNEMIVTGTDGGQWAEIWYVNPSFNHHFSGNINVFKRVKHMMGVETKSGMNNFLFIRGVGSVEMKTGNETLNIQSVFYSPEIDRNVLSLDQLTLQGYTVKKSGDKCKIYPMFSTPTVNSRNETNGLTKEEELGLYEKRRLLDLKGVDDEFKESYLNSYFETLNVSNEDDNDWTRLILKSLKFREFADCKALIDMLDDRDEGGYREVTTENTWPIVAKDLGFEYEDGDYIRLIYAMYLDVLEYYYKFKTVQDGVHEKEMINENAGSKQGFHRRTGSAENVQESTTRSDQNDIGPSQSCFRRTGSAGDVREGNTRNDQANTSSMHYALFSENGWTDSWNMHKRRRKFNFSHIKKVMDDANKSVMQQGSNITKV